MGKIPVDQLIADFRRMYNEHWRYVWGAAEKGCVDCSGAFVYAYRQHGANIAHGSNTIARSYVKGLMPVTAAAPGMAAFKIREPGHPKYALPAKFKKGGAAYNGDLNDYYHIGLVDETGKYVLNAQGTNAGFTRTKISLWGAVGYLKAVEYPSAAAAASPQQAGATKEGDKPMQKMVVTAKDVAVRKGDSTEAMVIKRLPKGTVVDAFDDIGGWREIIYQGIDGWMMSKFLAPADESDPAQAYVRTLTAEELQKLQQLREQMVAGTEFLKTIVGVG
jgi:hypothetical protein